MATASVKPMMLWTDLEGCELNGRWRLLRQVRSEGRTGWFEAQTLDGKPVTLIITETLNDEDELMDRLRATAKIRHPNVVAIEDSLVARLEDTPMVVVVTEPTEENLGDVLRERALGPEETRQVMDALLAGLAAIHEQGLVHGRMEAASVLATGDTIKLRSDCVHPGGENFSATVAEDVRGLGRIVVQSLTRRIPSGENDPVMQLVPEPMARAVRRALAGRATVEEMASLAGIRLVPPPAPPVNEGPKPGVPMPVVPEAVKAAPAAAPAVPQANPESAPAKAPVPPTVVPPTSAEKSAGAATAAPKPLPPSAPIPAPAAAAPVAAVPAAARNSEAAAAKPEAGREAKPEGKPEPARIGRQSKLLLEDEEPAFDRRKAAPWIMLVALALIVITAFVIYGMMRRHPAQPQPAASAPAATTNAPAPRAEAARPAAGTPAGRSAAGGLMAPAGPGWRVVAYTYNHEKQAQEKAASLARRFPQLRAGVFAPRDRGPYLVTLGGVMSKADAEAYRQRAIRMGLPRDTYAQNFR